MTRWINRGETTLPIDTKKVEKLKNAKYVGDFCIKTSNGNWTDSPVQIYYQSTPPNPNFSNYFAVLERHGTTFITSGSSTADIEITGVEADDGEIIYSRFRHDYRLSSDGTAMIDGGRDYTKSNVGGRFVTLMIRDGNIVIIE